MNRVILPGSFLLSLIFVLLFLSCKQKSNEKELWAVVINFISPDTTHYTEMKKFPFPDSLRFAPLENFFTTQNKLPAINDSSIVFHYNYRQNGYKKCCKQDTLEVFIDSIRGKKYLFAIGEYITVFQSNNSSDSNLRTRRNEASILVWNIKLNTPYPPSKFIDSYEKLGARYVRLHERFDEVSKQKWSENDSILVETIRLKNSTDRIITALQKDMNEHEVDSTIGYLRNKFPGLSYKETAQPDSDGNPLKIITINFEGVSISFTQVSASEYSFMMTDYYETIKLILNNAGSGYSFKDDLTIY